MKIRSKLGLLVGTVIVSSLIIIGLLLVMLAPVLTIQTEQGMIEELQNAQYSLSNTVLRVPDMYVDQGTEVMDAAIARSDAAFEAVLNMQILPSLSPKIAEALERIERLQSMQTRRQQTVVDVVDEIKAEVEEALGYGVVFMIGGLEESPLVESSGKDFYIAFMVQRYNDEVNNLVTTMDATISTLAQQEELINSESRKIILRGLGIAGVFALVLMSATVVLSLVMARRIGSDVLTISRSMAELAEGDLRMKEPVTSKDEIGDLSRALSEFTDQLTDSVRRIYDAADQTRLAREELSGAAEEASSAAEQMQSNTGSIESQIKVLDGSVEESSIAVGGITADIGDTDKETGNQASLVDTASTAVTEMSASIATVGRLADENAVVTEELESAARTGGTRLSETTGTVASIREGIDGVQAITGIIQSIASRTNLLAMNAAIEAAHAGDAGRGFAVVADEIRKLAEASATNSKEISGLLAAMISSIQAADDAGQETRKAFDTLESRVKDVKQASVEIRGSMKELETGSREIGDNMLQLSEASARINENTTSMRGRSDEIQEGMGRLGRVSREVSSGVSDITSGLTEVNSSMSHMLDLSRRITGISENLDQAVAVFRLKADDTDADDASNDVSGIDIVAEESGKTNLST